MTALRLPRIANVGRAHHDAALERARRGSRRRVVYWATRAVVQPFFMVWFRLERSGREHIPPSGPVILAANHRSVLDPIVLGLLLRRPVYFVAKEELFRRRSCAWFLGALGAFPVYRGKANREAIDVASEVLERGDVLVIFPEGKCMPPGAPGRPRRGVGVLAEATGATVVPIGITGTEAANTRRVPPRRIRLHAGRPLPFERSDRPATPRSARAATERIWAGVMTALARG